MTDYEKALLRLECLREAQKAQSTEPMKIATMIYAAIVDDHKWASSTGDRS